MRASTIRNLLLLCCLVVFVCGTSSEKVCNCEHCRCAANAATSSSSASAGAGGGGGGGAVQVSNLPPATKVAYVADEVLSSFPTCKDCGEYHHHHHHNHHQPRPRSNNDHSSAQIYRQEAARRVSEPCRCQLKVGNGNNELRTTIRLEPAQHREAVTKIVLPKSSPKSEQISSVSVVPSNIARIVKKKELLKKESETTLKPLLIDFEQLQKLLTSGSLTNNNNNNNNAASDKDKRMPTPIILYVVAAPNAALEKSKPIEAAKGSEPIPEPATTPKARANNDSEPLRMTQLAGRTSIQGFAKKFRRSPNLRQRRLDESTRASSTVVPTAIKASKISLKTTTTTTTTTSAPPHRSPPRPLGQWLRGLRQLAESSTVPSESSSSGIVTERSKRWIKNPTNGHAAPVRPPPPPARSPAASKKVPKKTCRRITGSDQQTRQRQPLEGPDTRLTLSSLEKSFTAAGAMAKKKKTASLKKRLSPPAISTKSATQEEQSAAAPKSPSKPASLSASKLASGDSTSDSLDTVDQQQQRRYKLVRRHLSSRGQSNDYWIMRIPKRNESTFATVIADAANFVAKLFSNGRRSYDRD